MVLKGLKTIHSIHYSPWAKGPKIISQLMDHRYLDFLFKFNRPQKTFENFKKPHTLLRKLRLYFHSGIENWCNQADERQRSADRRVLVRA